MDDYDRKKWTHAMFKSLPGYPWLDPCPRCGFRESCDCTVLERARSAIPALRLDLESRKQ